MSLAEDGAALGAAIASCTRERAVAAIAAAEFEAAGRHELDGSRTMRSWLRDRAGMDELDAVRLLAMGRKLRALPVLRSAVLDGLLSGGQLHAVVANVPARHLARFAEHEADVVPTLCGLDVEGTERAMQAWRRYADAIDEPDPRAERPNEVHLSGTLDGRAELRGSFDADTHAVVAAALRMAAPRDFDLSSSERNAAALAQVCQHFCDHQQTRRGGRHRPHLNVTITYEEWVERLGGTYVDTGQAVSPAALGVLCCDSAVHRLLVESGSGILDYGRATRSWPVDLYNAIVLRDGGCRFPGCTAPASWCDVHHVVEWEHGGDTSIDNGCQLCRWHHHLVHRRALRLKLLPGGTVEVTMPDGTTRTSQPRGPAPVRLPVGRRPDERRTPVAS